MSSAYHDMEEVDTITVGTLGEVGARLFLLQVRHGDVLVTLKLEKQQVSALAEYLGRVLADLARPGHLPGRAELESPAEPEWVVGTIGIHYDEDADKILLLIEEATEGDEEVGSALRVMITREQCAALAMHGAELVAAGRPACPLCGLPMDPDGHPCPRTNGHKPVSP